MVCRAGQASLRTVSHRAAVATPLCREGALLLATWGGVDARTSVREHIREGGVEKGAPSEEAPRWREPPSGARKEVCAELV